MLRHTHCPECGKVAIEESKSKFLNVYRIKLRCGHVISERIVTASKTLPSELITSIDGKHPRSYQDNTYLWLTKNNFRGVIGHAPGVGKTVCSLIPLALHRKELTPCLVVTKNKVKWQFFKEAIRWCGPDFLGQVLAEGKSLIFPNMPIYFCSYDFVRRNYERVIKEICPKLIVLDECQAIKNERSARAIAVHEIVSQCAVKHILPMSGTPIKNHAGEWFSILNLLYPMRFPSKESFLYRWVSFTTTESGYQKPNSLKDVARWKEYTSDIILRYERSEVLPDLPQVSRDFQYIDIDTDLKKAYEKEESRFLAFYKDIALEGRSLSFKEYNDLLAFFARMRHLAGLGKIEWVIDNITDFLLATEEKNEKVIIFTHHNDVANYLYQGLSKVCTEGAYDVPVLFLADSNDEKSEERKNEFINNPRKRIMIASTLASGEGVDGLQSVCNYMIMMERQWNPSNEEQAEDRLCRSGQEATKITAVYPIVLGTIEEWFTELVEHKRNMFAEAVKGDEHVTWDENSIVTELASQIALKRDGKRWSY